MTCNDRDFRDDDLRERFAALRREEEVQVPEFKLPSPRGARLVGRRFIGLAAVTACLAMLALAVFLMPLAQRNRHSQPSVSLAEWRAPSDFLLETPGRGFLRAVPAIGVWHGYTKDLGLRQKHPQARKRVLP